MSKRVAAAPGEVIDRTRPVRVVLDGRAIQGFQGDTIASAMAAAGIQVTGRSFKYHRPRGLFCMSGACANCMVRVDGVPNIQACQTPIHEGMRVERQNGLPSVDFDVMRSIDRFSFVFPPGFYYKSLYRPRFLWPLAERFVRRAAGIGEPPATDLPRSHLEAVNLHPDVLVIGGGRAGLGAAIESARSGARTMLLESEPALGGRLRFTDPGHAARLAAEAGEAGVDVRLSTAAFGCFEYGLVAAAAPHALLRIRPSQTVFATGGLEQPLPFGNNDLPGVMLASAAERLVGLYRVLPGTSAVVLTGSERGYQTAQLLLGAGASVTLLDWRGDSAGGRLSGERAQVHTSAIPVQAVGGKSVHALVAVIRGARHSFACDLVVMAGQIVPASGLLGQAGVQMRYDQRLEAFVPGELQEGVRIAGAVAGGDPEIGVTLPPKLQSPAKSFTCLCMDVTTKEMEWSVSEGFDSIELLKRYTTLGMGPCQGKSCIAACVRYAAELTGRTVPETGVPTSRAPWRPVELGLLAADHVEPRKESPLHDCHLDLGAQFLWAGEWRRPRQYREPAEECRAVHERVAIIDVSTLGKFRVKGPDAVTLLERIYPNRYGDLKVGRIRYAAILNDQGVILDDGTVGRVADDEFFVTTTTTGADAIDQWIKWWQADWNLRAHVVNISSQYAAINIAGPSSRELMARLTNADVSREAMPYLKLAQAEVAGVQSLVLRIGFVGELSYEVHFPSAYAEFVWESMLEAGEDLGILPFGLETQRILRLEKQHIIVGQDTDALSTPFGAAMDWMVKLDKPDFLGRGALAADAERGTAERLVGFKVESGGLPLEGAALVGSGMPVGRVCSSRWSDAAGAFVGLAWVPSPMGEDGTPLEFRSNGTRVVARVHRMPFYDPDGVRLRS